jgi:hypothetical protein
MYCNCTPIYLNGALTYFNIFQEELSIEAFGKIALRHGMWGSVGDQVSFLSFYLKINE